MGQPTISLREAILLGEAWPQCDAVIMRGAHGQVYEACILGGAALAINSRIKGEDICEFLVERYPELQSCQQCPKCRKFVPLYSLIAIHLGKTISFSCTALNGRWTRREVVAWLDEIGITQPPATDAEHEERETDVTRRTTYV